MLTVYLTVSMKVTCVIGKLLQFNQFAARGIADRNIFILSVIHKTVFMMPDVFSFKC